jgi:hypothetical protein
VLAPGAFFLRTVALKTSSGNDLIAFGMSMQVPRAQRFACKCLWKLLFIRHRQYASQIGSLDAMEIGTSLPAPNNQARGYAN